MLRRRTWLPLTFAVALSVTACSAPTATPVGSDAPSGIPSAAPSVQGGDADGVLQIEEGSAGGPGISIDDALGQPGIGPVLVNGALFIAPDDTMLLCSAIAESFPPQCGGTRLEVRGLEPSAIPNLEEEDGVRWAEQIQLFGTVALIET